MPAKKKASSILRPLPPVKAKSAKLAVITKGRALVNFKMMRAAMDSAVRATAAILSDPDAPIGLIAQIQATLKKEYLKPIESQVEEARARLLAYLEVQEPDMTKSTEATLAFTEAEYKVQRRVNQSRLPAAEKLREFLKTKGLNESDAFDAVITYTVSENKLQQLVHEKKVTQEELDGLKSISSTQLWVERI